MRHMRVCVCVCVSRGTPAGSCEFIAHKSRALSAVGIAEQRCALETQFELVRNVRVDENVTEQTGANSDDNRKLAFAPI